MNRSRQYGMAAMLLALLAGSSITLAQQQAPYVPIPGDAPFRGSVTLNGSCSDGVFEERVDQIVYDNSFSTFGEINPELVGIGSTNVMDDILFPASFSISGPRMINSVRLGVYVPTAQSGDFDVVITAWPTLEFGANPMVGTQPLGRVRVPVSSLGTGVWELNMTGINGPCGNLNLIGALNPGRIGFQVSFTQPDSGQLMPFPSAGTGVQTIVPVFARGQVGPVGSSTNSYASDDNGNGIFQGGNPPLVGAAGGPHEHRIVSNAAQAQDMMVRLEGAAMWPYAVLHTSTTYTNDCCYSIDVGQETGVVGDIQTIIATIPPGAVVSSASNGTMTGAPAPVISGNTVTWTVPSPGLNAQGNYSPQYTLQICFAALPAGAVINFEGREPATFGTGPTSVSYLGNQVACGPVDCQCPNGFNPVVTTFTAGVADGYSNSNGSETSSPDSSLLTWMNSTANPPGNGFDDPTQNRKFGHTFTGLPANIQCATLEIRMKAGATIPCTDSLSLGYQGGTSPFVWGKSLPTLDGGNWNPGEDRTFVFDLGNLNGGGNLLPFMNSNGKLDVYVQDDTMVDYIILKVKTCEPIDPCDCPVGQVRQTASITAGTIDNFATTADPAPTPSAPFLAYLNANPNPVTGFDQTVANRVFGHTFTGLPSTITCAHLEIKLKAVTDGSTDSMSFGYQPATNNFAWGISLPVLNGGSWPSGSVRTYNFDLSNVNGSGTSLINFMNTNGSFDVYVQDDTAVDYITLTYDFCEPGCDDIDFNNDTSTFDPQDIDAFLSVYGEGPCIPIGSECNDIDFNNDGSVFDPCDIDSFLLMFSEGPCTPCGL